MNHTLKQRSQLVQVAERGLDAKRRGNYIIAAVGIVGCVVVLILNWMGVA